MYIFKVFLTKILAQWIHRCIIFLLLRSSQIALEIFQILTSNHSHVYYNTCQIFPQVDRNLKSSNRQKDPRVHARLRDRRAFSFMWTTLPKFWGPILLNKIRNVNFFKIFSIPGYTLISSIFQYKLEGSTNSM